VTRETRDPGSPEGSSAPPPAVRRTLPAWRDDVPASIVVFLVALPLCLGIALASGAPLLSGLITGIVGGTLVGALSGSSLAVSGPAAGLTVIVLAAVEDLGSFEAFLVAVVFAGALQLTFGFLRGGILGSFIPDAVIKGMLAAIGLILILKQIPHAFGWHADPEGDLKFVQPDGENTFSEIWHLADHVAPGAMVISLVSLGILILWESPWVKGRSWSKLVPGPLLVVVFGAATNALYGAVRPEWALGPSYLVTIPTAETLEGLFTQLPKPDWSVAAKPAVWLTAVTIALVASLETLLSIEATDKLDPKKAITPTDRELKAQGVGNIVAGLLGGLPMTAVIVRSSANVATGAKTRWSAILHGLWLILALIFGASLVNQIPLASLAAILLVVGFKLTRPSLFRSAWIRGFDQFIPFLTTIIAILFTDLLVGILVGLAVGLFFVMKTNYQAALTVTRDDHRYLIRLKQSVSFLNKHLLRKTFEDIPEGSYVIIDGTRCEFLDDDIVETIEDFVSTAELKGITVEIKRRHGSFNDYFRKLEEGSGGSSEAA